MAEIIHGFNSWSKTVADLALAVLWQSTLLVLLAGGACFLMRRAVPGARYWLLQIVAIKLLLMPFWTLAIPFPAWLIPQTALETAKFSQADETDPQGGELSSTQRPNLFAGLAGSNEQSASPEKHQGRLDFTLVSQIHWQSWMALGWLVGLIWQAGRMIRQRWRLGSLLRRVTPVQDRHWLAFLDRICHQLDLRHRVVAVQTDEDCSPFVCGLLRPILVLPRGLVNTLSPNQMPAVLIHELAHIKRRDLLWGWISEIARMLYFFNPVVYWLHYRIRLERELACDQLAMTLSGQSAAEYAETLVQVVSQASLPRALQAAAASALGLDGGSSESGVRRQESAKKRSANP